MLPSISYTPQELPTMSRIERFQDDANSQLLLHSSTTTITSVRQVGLNSRIDKLLQEYATLRDNWDDDGGKAPNHNAIDQANYITGLLEKHGQPIFHAAPGPNGEIMLDIRNQKKSKSLEIVFYETRFVAIKFSEMDHPSQQPFDAEKLPALLKWLNS